jgi:predicted Zn-dependent protease with MMP-like domain
MNSPDPIERVLDLAEEALDRGDPRGAIDLCGEALATRPDHPGAWYLRAEAFRDLGEIAEAESSYRRATTISPEHAPSWCSLGTILFDQLRFADAQACIQRAIRLDPELPEGYWGRALLRERRGDHRGSRRDFLRANLIDSRYHLPVLLDDETVEEVVEEALRELNGAIGNYLENVPIILEEVPDEDICRQWDPPMPPAEILGYFSGATAGERTGGDAWSALPATIVLFRRNLERAAWDREGLIEELRITVFHEVGHYLGLDEDDLERRGLD